MNIDNMTIKQAREIAALFGSQAHGAKAVPFRVGSAYLIRTVTMHWTGRVVAIEGDFLVLDEAAWIADTGRYHKATSVDALAEVEPAGDGVLLNTGAVIDARPWSGDLPRSAK